MGPHGSQDQREHGEPTGGRGEKLRTRVEIWRPRRELDAGPGSGEMREAVWVGFTGLFPALPPSLPFSHPATDQRREGTQRWMRVQEGKRVPHFSRHCEVNRQFPVNILCPLCVLSPLILKQLCEEGIIIIFFFKKKQMKKLKQFI